MSERQRARLLARTDQDGPGGCWIWQGGVAQSYGIMSRGARTEGREYAHRISYEVFIGPIPEGLHIDHLCRVRLCVNPDHLEAVTQAENNARITRDQTSCLRGHPLEGDNLRATTDGSRQCMTCQRERARAKWPERKVGMSHVSTMVPSDLYSAAKARARAEGTTITAVLTRALADFVEDDSAVDVPPGRLSRSSSYRV